MLECDNDDLNIAGQSPEPDRIHGLPGDYLSRAREACASGDKVLGMHLYLTAYEEAMKAGDPEAVSCLHEAWKLACELKERSIAEYIFDKLEPHLSAEQAPAYASQLQSLALDKLSEYGISRGDLEDMAEMISEEIGANAHITGISPIVSMHHSESSKGDDESSREALPSSASADVQKPTRSRRAPRLRYADLVGFDSVIEDARALGLGIEDDEEYRTLLATLRSRHGLDGLSAAGSVVFRTSSREDANHFMEAVVGELDLPAMRIQMQPGPMGVPMLCVTVSADRQPHMVNRMTFDAPSVLVLEDIDVWGAPLLDAASSVEGEGPMFASMSRAAREAVGLVTSAVENPDVYVLASVAGDSPDQGYLYDLMEPMSVVDIYLPDEVERRQIWNKVALDHPSVRMLNITNLTRMSRNMSRCDIFTAAREAVEDAYRQGLKARHYLPVTQELVYEHLSNFQPLESAEYKQLEEAVVDGFRSEIDALDASFAAEEAEQRPAYDARGSEFDDAQAAGGVPFNGDADSFDSALQSLSDAGIVPGHSDTQQEDGE